ncbi:uncharacterized protein EV420DRAFT_1642979 [Desarmillaria tabescens]|uniref:Secreted protein n=1 Tax=Armillaria tabescens TaxID=1929756 RepID=A0AA39KET0_ARMTA|nr:uncharacterized protein EV420DRAFT_1642979 [Desarmillaria tabescens]KAK0458640.1 hypothetical protein EV420DRAFT_1642979 [Desarmillaria tabescens]
MSGFTLLLLLMKSTSLSHIQYDAALATLTMQRTLQASHLPLTCLATTVWRDIRGQVVQEHGQFRESKKMSLSP